MPSTSTAESARIRELSPTYYKTLVDCGYAPVNGLEMYYEIHGSGRPLVTIHPFAGLANVLPSLCRHRRLIAAELKGQGRTRDTVRSMSFEQDADDVAALLTYLKIDEADVFGESLGGIVAVHMAVRHSAIVRRV